MAKRDQDGLVLCFRSSAICCFTYCLPQSLIRVNPWKLSLDQANPTKMQMCVTPGSSTMQCQLLDKRVGFKCLASLLGVGHGRVRKRSCQAPDLRHGKREYQSKPGTWTVDGFLQIAYDSIAETLPDQFLSSM